MLNLTKLETVDIPLNKLTLWDDNVRTSGAEDNLGELVASIRAIGLLQSLVVKKAPRGTFTIGAGKRRFLALSQMAEQGDVKRSYAVPCRIAPDDADLTEISLAENICREEMTLRQQVAAFSRMIDEGKCIPEIAVRFGLTDTIVQRRLALARLSPVLWDAYDSGDMSMEALQAFTLSTDHETQERLWRDLPEWERNKPAAIRRILANQDIPASDRTVRFVGLDNYTIAGGPVKRDLFSEGEDGTFVCDAALLSSLAAKKIEAIAAQAKQDGWKWVEVNPNVDHQTLGQFRRLQPTPVELPKKVAAALDKLQQKESALQEQLDNDVETDEEASKIDEHLQRVQEQIAGIEIKYAPVFDADTKAKSGTIVTIGPDGKSKLVSGLLSKADAAALAPSDDAAHEPASETPTADEAPAAYPAALVETLTTLKTTAIAAELSQQPKVALAAVVHAMILSQFDFDYLTIYGFQSCLQVRTTRPNLATAVDSKAGQSLGTQQTAWVKRLPRRSKGSRTDQFFSMWDWCLAQDQDTLLSLLAFCSALSLNAIQTKNDPGTARRCHADALATALNMDMRNWFTPTADNFFGKVSKTRILEAMTEAGKAPNSNAPAQMKKGPLAELAEKTLTGTGWLPEPIRIAPRPADAQDEAFDYDEDQEVNDTQE